MIDKIVTVDFDDTICPWNHGTENVEPYPGVVSAMQQLRSRGYEIIILTSRMSRVWWKYGYEKHNYIDPQSFGMAQYNYIRTFLDFWLIPWDEITAEKPPARVYFDDLAVRITGENSLGLAVATFLFGEDSE